MIFKFPHMYLPSLVISMIILILLGCQRPKEIQLRVAVAASVQFAMRELVTHFEQNQDIICEIVIGSSGKLATQIIQGAPFDIFFSADMGYPNAIYEKGLSTRPEIYACGVPIIWTYDQRLYNDDVSEVLHNSNINRIAIANPKVAPFGKKSLQFLNDHGLYDSVKSKLVLGESVSQVNDYIINQNVEIGITAKSVLFSQKIDLKGRSFELDSSYIIPHAMTLIKARSQSIQTIYDFSEYVLSEKGQSIFRKHGYSTSCLN